jgi:glycine cleavage system H lipoate-binding protein
MKNSLEKKRASIQKRIVGFQVLEDECIWMKAGVVNYRICDNTFDCNTCGFDKAMRKAMDISDGMDTQKVAPRWVEHLMKRYDGANRPCRHALTGRIEAPKICTLNYECYHCTFDQMLDDWDLLEDLSKPYCKLVSGFKMADGYYYHMGHSWVRFEHGGRVRVGFDDFLNRLFGYMTAIELPPIGANLIQNKVGWVFSRQQHQAAMLSPVTGTVLAVNHRVREHPDIPHEDPYQNGWLFILEPNMPKRNLKRLYFGEEGFRWMEQENRKLLSLMGPEYESMAATGAGLVEDIYGAIEEIGWDSLVEDFLHTAKC